MKAVLISIRPKWCELIASGLKSVEVRKVRPKIETPFKCYIYCTKPDTKDPHQLLEIHGHDGKIRKANGKVIGEFVCDYICPFFDYKDACISRKEIEKYAGEKILYGWHISDLNIYDKPRELSEFYVCKDDVDDYCSGCAHHECNEAEYPCCECIKDERNRAYLYRPPQSWYYVEENV